MMMHFDRKRTGMMNSVRASPRKNKDNLIMKFSFFFKHLYFVFSAGASIFLMAMLALEYIIAMGCCRCEL